MLEESDGNDDKPDDEMPDEEELPDCEALEAFLNGSSDDEMTDPPESLALPEPQVLPGPDLVQSDSSNSSDPDDLPFMPSNKK